MVFADVDGCFGYRVTGQVPIRAREERGYRRGWDPADAWQGVIPFEGMPAVREPARGWVATDNNLPAPSDSPYPLANMSPTGYRARRIRQMVESREIHGRTGHGVDAVRRVVAASGGITARPYPDSRRW